jgi:hypothetical protein
VEHPACVTTPTFPPVLACQENVYWLLDAVASFLGPDATTFAVFISNPGRHVAVWCQKAAQATGMPVVWDYHGEPLSPRRVILPVLSCPPSLIVTITQKDSSCKGCDLSTPVPQ